MPIILLLILASPLAKPPAELDAWIRYAQALHDKDPLCPPGLSCVQFSRITVTGSIEHGQIELSYAGSNLGRVAQASSVLAPTEVFSVESVAWQRGKGALTLRDNAWEATVEPGDFELRISARFAPKPSVPVTLPSAVGSVQAHLQQGTLTFDESSDRHGGTVYLQTQGDRHAGQAAVSLRATRSLHYGSVMTFEYHFAITGLREQTRVLLPLLGNERVEEVQPPNPFSPLDQGLEITLNPGTSHVTVLGYFTGAAAPLRKPSSLPFEHWLVDIDQRHPADIESDGLEIDPSEVSGITPLPESRAFFLAQAQGIHIKPLAVAVDRGRRGTGTASVSYVQGYGEQWVGSLQLQASIAPDTDRIHVPTPEAPHYAEASDEAVRMFADGDILSLRMVNDGADLEPIRVQWRERIAASDIASTLTFAMPGQDLHLDVETVEVSLLPGQVPLAVLGANTSSGHVIDGLHLYGLLLALLAAALTRLARFPVWATAITGVLFAGLYAVDSFPRSGLLLLLFLCGVLVRVPARIILALQSRRFLHFLAGSIVTAMLAAATLPVALYMKDRVYAALRPWSIASRTKSFGSYSEYDGLLNVSSDAVRRGESAPNAEEEREFKAVGKLQQNVVQKQDMALPTEKSVRPVPLAAPSLPAVHVRWQFGALLPGQAAQARLVLAGPWLRAAWMFTEVVALATLLALLATRAARLWKRGLP